MDALTARLRRPSTRLLLAGVVALAAVLRFTALDARGWWRDEAVTVELLRLPFGELLQTIPDSEGTPPLYYVLAWGWTHVVGESEVGLRSFSALVGTLVVPVVYLAARELASVRVALVAALLAAVSPFLVWHAQDGRSYSLLVLLSALSFLFFVRLLRTRTRRDAGGFALASMLALPTHYFAVFLVVPQAVWLLTRRETRRSAAAAAAAIGAVGAALIPLALAQRGNVSWVSDVPFDRRLLEIVQEFLVGPQAPWERLTTVLAAVLAGAALALLLVRGTAAERRAVIPAAAIGGLALALPVVLAPLGLDYVLGRNLIVAWVPLAVVVAAGLAAERARFSGLALAAATATLAVVAVVVTADDAKFGAEDWRSAAEALGDPPPGGRAIVLWPEAGSAPFRIYRPSADELRGEEVRVSEVVVLVFGERRRHAEPFPGLTPPDTFRQAERRDASSFATVRYEASEPSLLAAKLLDRSAAAILVER